MLTWAGKVLCLAGVCAAFLWFGVLIGAKSHSIVVEETPRFQRISDVTALDTKTGRVCRTGASSVPVQIDPQTGERVPGTGIPVCTN